MSYRTAAKPTIGGEIDTQPEQLVRIYADISKDAERRLRIRVMMLETASGKLLTRKAYIEKLIAEDIAKVKGASLREITQRKSNHKE